MPRLSPSWALATLAMAFVLPSCGGGGGGGPTGPAPTPTPLPPAATIEASGNGALVVHPSINPSFHVALETPIRITETAGGTADWNFARMSLLRRGVELERAEIGSDIIRNAGFSRINARSNQGVVLLFRLNNDTFDQVNITLGFGDIRDGRQFTSDVPFNSFTDVNVSLTPLSIPHDTVERRE